MSFLAFHSIPSTASPTAPSAIGTPVAAAPDPEEVDEPDAPATEPVAVRELTALENDD
jgi:hypothetical protein